MQVTYASVLRKLPVTAVTNALIAIVCYPVIQFPRAADGIAILGTIRSNACIHVASQVLFKDILRKLLRNFMGN